MLNIQTEFFETVYALLFLLLWDATIFWKNTEYSVLFGTKNWGVEYQKLKKEIFLQNHWIFSVFWYFLNQSSKFALCLESKICCERYASLAFSSSLKIIGCVVSILVRTILKFIQLSNVWVILLSKSFFGVKLCQGVQILG